MVATLIREEAAQCDPLKSVAVARDLTYKSDSHSAEEASMHCVHLPSQEQVTTATVIRTLSIYSISFCDVDIYEFVACADEGPCN